MSERDPGARHSPGGWLLIVFGVALPGLLALLAGLMRELDWLRYAAGLSELFARAVAVAVGIVLCSAAVGFARHRLWAWWVVVLWGAWSAIELTRDATSNPFVVTVSLPQLVAVLAVAYAWRRRSDFGVGSRSPRR